MVLKILALHGYSVNGPLFRKRMSAIRKQISGDCEFFFVDGPIVLPPSDVQGAASEVTARELSERLPEDIPRAWWRANEDKTAYSGVEGSVEFVRDLMVKEQFDGVFGFSQGAAFAALLSVMLERPEKYPLILIDGKPPQPPFKFGIYVGGFRPLDISLAPLFEDYRIKTPTLHVLGTNDLIVNSARGQTLVDACEDPRVERHEGGHFVPSTGAWRKFFQQYIKSFDGEGSSWNDIPSPTAILSKV